VRVTVPVEEVPPTTEAGLSVTDDSVGGFTVNAAERTVPYVPEMFAKVVAVTALVVTVKLADMFPEDTVTLVGTCAAALSLVSVTTAPPERATELSVTVAVDELPPTTVAGESVIEVNVGGGEVTVRFADFVVPYTADMETVVSATTGVVVMVKVALVALPATVTLAGAWAIASLLVESVTMAPVAGAALDKVTVPVEEPPPCKEDGLSVTDDTFTAEGP
jgi:hypothetical protein